MDTPIGAGWKGAWAGYAALVGVAAVALDLVQRGAWPSSIPRIAVGVAVLVILTTFATDGKSSVGLRWPALPSWSYWPKWTLALGSIVLAGALLISAFLWMFGSLPPIESQFATEGQFLPRLWHGCLRAPLEEELLYRAALCAPLVALLGTRWTVLIGGIAFAGLHMRYGNLAPNHVFAGFVMSWAYLRSGNLLVPILLHSLGNFLVWLLHVALFYWG